MKNKKNLIYITFIFIALCFMTVTYSALNTELLIDGKAHVRVDADIRINKIEFVSSSNDAKEQYNSDYSKDSITTGIVLPNDDSEITYKVTINNKSENKYVISDITSLSNLDNVYYEIDGYNLKDTIDPDSELELLVTYKTNSGSGDLKNIVLEMDFKKQYILTLKTPLGSTTSKYIYEGSTYGELPSLEYSDTYRYDPEPSGLKTEYSINSWGSNPTTYQFNLKITNTSNSAKSNWSVSYPVPADAKIAGLWSGNAVIADGYLTVSSGDYNGSLGVGESAELGLQISTNAKSLTLKENENRDPVIESRNYIFDGWYTSKLLGKQITSDSIVEVDSDQTLYARWRSPKPICAVTNGTGRDPGDEVTCNNDTFYLVDNDGDYMQLLSVKNVNTNSNRQSDQPNTVAFDNKSNKYSGSEIEGYVNAYVEYLKQSLKANTIKGRLLEYDVYDNLIVDNASWLHGNNYWLGTPVGNDKVWFVVGQFNFAANDDYKTKYNFGVRPLIIIPNYEF